MIEIRGQSTVKGIIVVVFILVAGLAVAGMVLGVSFSGDANQEPTKTTVSTDSPEPTTTSTRPLTSTPTPTLTPRPTQTATLTPRPDPTSTPTATPSERDKYLNFLAEMEGGMNQSARAPLRIRGITIQENVLYLVHNATSTNKNATRKYVEWGDIAITFAGAVRDTKKFYNQSKVPSKMVVFETNSSNLAADPGKFVVTTEDSFALRDDKISTREFTKRWQDTLERQEQRDEKFANVIDRNKVNITYYPDKPAEVEGE